MFFQTKKMFHINLYLYEQVSYDLFSEKPICILFVMFLKIWSKGSTSYIARYIQGIRLNILRSRSCFRKNIYIYVYNILCNSISAMNVRFSYHHLAQTLYTHMHNPYILYSNHLHIIPLSSLFLANRT